MKLIVTAGVLTLLMVLVGTRFFIKFLSNHEYGQFVRDDGPTTHKTKRGTPTMGGIDHLLRGNGLCDFALSLLDPALG